jgi:hypothetical protein
MVDAATSPSGGYILLARAGGIHVPPEVIAGWPSPNHVNPVERGWGAPIALSILLILTILVYVARMWARLTMTKNAGVDDILISIAMIPLIGLSIATIIGTSSFPYLI